MLTGCSDDGGGDADAAGAADAQTDDSAGVEPGEEAQVGPPYETLTFDVAFVDDTRVTPEIAGTGVPGSDDRTLVTTIRRPVGEGPFPLIVFSHGHNGHPRKFTRLLSAWAAAGYVVAAPEFPLSSDEVPGEPSVFDLSAQSGDVSFLIDELLAAGHEPGNELRGAIDDERIGIGGLSLGAATTYTAAFGECCQDERVDAVVALSGLAVPVDDANLETPTFVAHSPDDPVLPYDSAAEMYGFFTGPKYFLTVFEGGHSTAYEDNDGHPASPLLDLGSTRFWDRYLAGDASVPEEILTEDELGGLATLEHAG